MLYDVSNFHARDRRLWLDSHVDKGKRLALLRVADLTWDSLMLAEYSMILKEPSQQAESMEPGEIWQICPSRRDAQGFAQGRNDSRAPSK